MTSGNFYKHLPFVIFIFKTFSSPAFRNSPSPSSVAMPFAADLHPARLWRLLPSVVGEYARQSPLQAK